MVIYRVKLLALFLLIYNALAAQVIIGPEIGVSRAPLLLYGANSFDESKSFDLTYGLSGAAKISDRLSLGLRAMYVERERLTWRDLCICDTKVNYYEHSDLNVDLTISYNLWGDLGVGLGPSLIRKIDAVHTREFFSSPTTERVFNDTYYALNAQLFYRWRRFLFKTMYVRRFQPDDLIFQYTEGIHRLDFTVGYVLFGYRKFQDNL